MAAVEIRQKRILGLVAVPMALLALSAVYPVFFTINAALKTRKGFVLDRFGLASDPTLANFGQAWNQSRLSEYFTNSVLVTVGAVLRFRGSKLVFTIILISLMIPVQVVLVPFYRTMIALDLVNSRAGLVIAYTAFFLPFSVYLMTAFYARLPRELFEAAQIDGAGLVGVWWHIMLPLGKPALVTLGILNTLYCWNDVLISLLVLQDQRTLMVGIAALRGEYTTNVPLLAAGIVLAAAPIVAIYVVFQRQIVSGIAVGAVKG